MSEPPAIAPSTLTPAAGSTGSLPASATGDPRPRAIPAPGEPRPAEAAPTLRGSLQQWYEVVSVLVSRDHKARYRSTALGMTWAVASPLLFLLTFYMLFGVIMRIEIPNYATYVFTGIVGWNWLQTSLNEGVASISQNSSLIAHPGFPTQALPMVSVVSNLINFLFALPIVILVTLIEHGSIGWTVLLVPLVMVVQFVLLLSLAFFVSAANVFFRDVQYILPVLLQLGYFMTPIFYDLKQMPGFAGQLLMLNPMTQVINGYRAALGGQVPDFAALGVVLVVALVLLVLSYRYFRNAAEHFLEEI